MTKKFFWLKLKSDFFNSKEMKKLRKIAGGDTYVIIYLKMQLLSLQNEGRLYYDGIDDDFPSEIALTLDEDIENVRVTIAFLMRCGLIECVSEEEYFMSQVPEITGKESDSASRMRKHRASHCDADVTNKMLQCDKNVTTEIEIEKDIELESEKEGEGEGEKEPSLTSTTLQTQQILNLYNQICVSLPKIRKLSTSCQKDVEKIISTYSEDEIKEAFEKAEKSVFLKGKKNSDKFKTWKADFVWIVKEEHFMNLFNGKYDNTEDDERLLDYESFMNNF